MKKLVVALMLICAISSALNAQSCVQDVWFAVRGREIPRAKRLVDDCLAKNPQSADVWLIRGTVYMRWHQEETNNRNKNQSYVIKDPEAILIANESFYKALELDPKITPRDGMVDAKAGQLATMETILFRGIAALDDEKNKEKAQRYLNVALRCFKMDPDAAALYNMGVIYMYLANIEMQNKNEEGYANYLQEAIKIKTTYPPVYTLLFDHYKRENDTVNCGKVIDAGRLVLPKDSNTLAFSGIAIEYYSMINDTDKAEQTVKDMLKQGEKNPAVYAEAANFLNNANNFANADEIIAQGFAIDTTFNLCFQKAYRYYREALTVQEEENKALDAGEMAKFNELNKKVISLFEEAYPWCLKAYEMNKEDRDNTILLRNLSGRIGKKLPEELQPKPEEPKTE